MNDKYILDATSSVNVKIADDVLATIASVAAEEVEGVVELQSTLKASVTDMLGVKNLTKGVKVNVGENEVVIDMFIVVEYGRNLVEVAKNVQDKVKDSIENMTGLAVVEVNVHISGIALPEKEKVKRL